ncbi:hypothetical protein G7047_12140 [Diaphorobacter sp. HDW4A]|uniref:hypothetical protein n=1 Tax=Diaphorobacter sp. HDW4A TaxID=2714924 RepID=UPI00140A3CF4|nr:hypothetical protein [Diaphorobacter sp. HDW4A]QIL80568.1 hypothetical protein G7047_12140 [Diaphorobacter sp. HDW4A]
MKKLLLATAFGIFATTSAFAQLGAAASNAADAAEHKVEQKQAESEAKKSGPVGKAVNNTKAEYHKAQSKRHTKKAKAAVKKSVS